MKRLILLPLVAVAATASAQTTSTEFGQSVSATIYTHLERRGMASEWPSVKGKLAQAIPLTTGGKTPNAWIGVIQHMARQYGWFPLNFAYGYPKATITQEGQSGCWKGNPASCLRHYIDGRVGPQECHELQLSEAADGALMGPSVPLPGSQPIVKGDATYFSTDMPSNGGSAYEMADTPEAAALWAIHHMNIGRPKSQWWGGVYVTDPANGFTGLRAVRPAYRDPVSGALIEQTYTHVTVHYNQFHWLDDTLEGCPKDGNGGSSFDWYTYSTSTGVTTALQDGCTAYAKNFGLSASGYGYPEMVPIGWTTDDKLLWFKNNFMASECRVSPELIRLVADRLYRAVAQQLGAGAPYEQITLDDVRNGGEHPIGFNLMGPTPISTGGDSYGVPSATTGGEEPLDYRPPDRTMEEGYPVGNNQGINIDLSHPDNPTPEFEAPTLGMPDWLPDLPAFSVPTGSGECPIFGFEAFGRQFYMTEHCRTIQEHQAIIATIMVVVFSFMSIIIILRA